MLDGIEWTPACVLADLFRAAKDDFLIRGTHQPLDGTDLRLHAREANREAQDFMHRVGSIRTQIVRLAPLAFHRCSEESPHCVLNVQESAPRLQVPNFYNRSLQAFLDPRQLPNEVGGCVVSFAWPSRV